MLECTSNKEVGHTNFTGGPASKIVYDIETEEAEYYFQDWFQPWTKATLNYKEKEALKEYVQTTFSYYLEEFESESMY